ncbi:MAG: hypothetical protein Q7S21_07285 [archaeon]|nr:hypothetical protein [archaeon]
MKIFIGLIIALIALTGCVASGSFEQGVQKLNSIDAKYGVTQENIGPDSMAQIASYKTELNSYRKEIESNAINLDKEKLLELIDLKLALNSLQETQFKAIAQLDSGNACDAIDSFQKVNTQIPAIESKIISAKAKNANLANYFSGISGTVSLIRQENTNLIQLLQQSC